MSENKVSKEINRISGKETEPVTKRDIFSELMEKARKEPFFRDCSNTRMEVCSEADNTFIAVTIRSRLDNTLFYYGNSFEGYGIITKESANRATIDTDNIALINYTQLWELFETYYIQYADLVFQPYSAMLTKPEAHVLWVNGKQDLSEILFYNVKKYRKNWERQFDQRQEESQNEAAA